MTCHHWGYATGGLWLPFVAEYWKYQLKSFISVAFHGLPHDLPLLSWLNIVNSQGIGIAIFKMATLYI
jgi:hypothetical protein